MKHRAGPELDRLIAERIFKRKYPTTRQMAYAASKHKIAPRDVHEGQWWVPELGGFYVIKKKGKTAYKPEIPRFSEKIEDAWQLVNHMKADGFSFRLYQFCDTISAKALVNFVCSNGPCPKHRWKEYNHHGSYDVEGKTVPMAICLGALKALKV